MCHCVAYNSYCTIAAVEQLLSCSYFPNYASPNLIIVLIDSLDNNVQQLKLAISW